MRRTVSLAALLCWPSLSFAADDTYEIKKTDAAAAVGAKGTASVTITSKKGWHLNQEAPLTLKLAPPPGVSLDKPKLGRADLARSTEDEARFDVGVTLSEPGQKLVEAEAGFVLCREDSCRPIKQKLTLAASAATRRRPRRQPRSPPRRRRRSPSPQTPAPARRAFALDGGVELAERGHDESFGTKGSRVPPG